MLNTFKSVLKWFVFIQSNHCNRLPFALLCTDLSRVFTRSRAPYSIYARQSSLIRSRTFGIGHPVIRSRVFGVRHRAIRSRAFGVVQLAIRSSAFGVGPTDIVYTGMCMDIVDIVYIDQRIQFIQCMQRIRVQCMRLFEVGDLRQLCLILDSCEKLKRVY